jgi:hypothetical protein
LNIAVRLGWNVVLVSAEGRATEMEEEDEEEVGM